MIQITEHKLASLIKEAMRDAIREPVSPGWLTINGAAKYSGLSEGHLKVLIKGGHVVSSNCKIPGNSKGRRLIKRASLDEFIESGIGVPASDIAMNQNEADG